MKRIHLFEIEDQSWCPRVLRDGITDYLRFFESDSQSYHPIFHRIQNALNRIRPQKIVDLCSGAGGPWINLHSRLENPIEVVLTDLNPNVAALELMSSTNKLISVYKSPVNAAQVPAELRGVRTLFSSFHHFPPEQASSILADAVNNRQGIMIFEMTRRTIRALLLMCFTPIVILLSTPFIKPFKWSRIFLTYVIPLIPIATAFDGIISCLRTYSPHELRELLKQIPNAETFHWEIGIERAGLPAFGITYLIGLPK